MIAHSWRRSPCGGSRIDHGSLHGTAPARGRLGIGIDRKCGRTGAGRQEIRFIAFAAPARDPQYPNVPATGEMPDLRGFAVSGWAGLFGARGLAPALRNQIAGDVAASLAAPEMMERYRVFGYEAPKLDPDEFAQLIRRETAAWGEIIHAANLRPD